MDSAVVYERKYPKVDGEALYQEMLEETANEPKEERLTFDQIIDKIYADVSYVLLPERVKACEAFIAVAIEVSELYEIDCKITRQFDRVTVDYSFDCGANMREMKRVFSLADDYCFFAGIYDREITISMDYYTHAMMRKGRIMRP